MLFPCNNPAGVILSDHATIIDDPTLIHLVQKAGYMIVRIAIMEEVLWYIYMYVHPSISWP